MPDSIFYKKFLFYGSLFFIIIILLTFSLNDYPIFGGDAVYYVPPAINQKLGHGLKNQLTDLFLVGDNTHSGKFIAFPPLYPLVLSSLMTRGTPHSAFIAIFILYLVTIIITSFIFLKLIIKEWDKVSWYTISICVLAFFSLATVSIFNAGRPETLSRLFLVLGILVTLYSKDKWLWILLGILEGLTMLTHPASAILFAPLIVVFFVNNNSLKNTMKLIFFTFAISASTFIFIEQFFGYGVLVNIKGIVGHFSRLNTGLSPSEYLETSQPPVILKLQTSLSAVSETIESLFVSRYLAFQGLLLTLSIAYLPIIYRNFKNGLVSNRALIFSCITILGALLLLYATRFTMYYALSLIPLCLLIILCSTIITTNSNVIKLLTLVILSLSSIVFFHRLILFPYFLKYGTSLEQARTTFTQLPIDQKKRIGIDETLWPISENYERIYLYGTYEDVPYPNTTIIMREGINSWTSLPSKFSYCKQIEDFSIHKKPILFGVKLSNTVPSYAYNVYDCSSRK